MSIMTAPSANTRLTRHIRAEDQGGGVVRGIFSSMDVDSHNSVLIPAGCDYHLYMTNGRSVNWHHGYDHRGRVPIAKTESLAVEGRNLVGTIRFGTDPFSQSVYHSFKDGTTRGFSIEFLEKKGKFGPPTKEEVRAFPEWKTVKTIHRAWQLMGVAATPDPSNPAAVALEVRSAPEYDYNRLLVELLRAESHDRCGHLDTDRLARSLVKHADLIFITASRRQLQQEK